MQTTEGPALCRGSFESAGDLRAGEALGAQDGGGDRVAPFLVRVLVLFSCPQRPGFAPVLPVLGAAQLVLPSDPS